MTTPPPGPVGGVSPLIKQPSSGLFTTSDFESKSHEELRAMVANADPGTTRALGDKLKTAADRIKYLGEALKKHMAAVEWEGQGGDAFREWGTDMANATLRLSEFSDSAGTWTLHAAQTLGDVKGSMPEVSAESKTVLNSYRSNHPGMVGSVPSSPLLEQQSGLQQQGPSRQQAYAAQQRLDADRAEAARLMRKLAESYAWSAHQMSTAERPTFRPMNMNGFFPGEVEQVEYLPAPGGSGRTGSSAGGEAKGVQPVGGGLQSAGYTPTAGGAHLGDGGSSVVRHVSRVELAMPLSHTKVDGGLAVPPTPIAPSSGLNTPPHTGETTNNPLARPAFSIPSMPPAGSGPAAMGAKPALPLGGSRAGAVPGSPARGIAGGQLRVPGVAAPGDGIVGGRPVPRSPGQVQPPTSGGTVIGTEPGQGRAQAGYAPYGATPGASSGPARGRSAAGRRLATEPGGVVGSIPRRRSAAADAAFTPGGTGLVRHATETNRVQNGPARRNDQRPEYLVEDEETWAQGGRRVVPPVID